jgi:5-methylcytosine-specific restriction endonuclease McrA
VSRDYQSPRYVRWRKAVYARDHFRCRLCGRADDLNAHHIKTWASCPALRFAVGNGITLCRVCHLRVSNNEEAYEGALGRLVRPADKEARLGLILMRHEEDEPLHGPA